MRIAVCRPQVPFVRGGAEIVADTLVDELRARGHEAELVTVPYKWYPGTRVLDQAFLWRLLDLERGRRAADRPRDRDEVPVLLRPPSEQGRLARCTSSGRPTTTTAPSSASSPSRREDRATRRAVERLDRVALGEARRDLRDLANVAERLRALHRARRRGAAAARRRSSPTAPPSPSDFVLSVNRLDRAKRIDLLIEAAKLDPSLRIVIAGDGPDRERLERLAAALNGQVEFTGRVDDERLADLYARCLAVFYAPVDEDYGMVPYEAFLSEKPVVTTTDAGGPLEIVHDRETGARRRARAAPSSRGRAPTCAAHVDEAKALGRAGKARRRARHLGRAASTRSARVKVAYYSPMPPSRSGIADYSALLLPALRERVEEVVVAEPGQARAARRTSRSTTSATTPTRTAGSSTRCARGPGVVVLHEFVLHHLSPG